MVNYSILVTSKSLSNFKLRFEAFGVPELISTLEYIHGSFDLDKFDVKVFTIRAS